MYKYKLTEQEETASAYQESRIKAFDNLEAKLDNIKKLLRQAKIETIKAYRDQPNTFAVIKPTDIIGDYITDIETLLK
tara:strand:+ start:178 stop:411 length:234 start_codon:yes stop_codon:yes gene_type:complete